MKRIFTILLLVCTFLSGAQDSTRAMRHEIGFNTVSLIKQLISNNPTSSFTQSPYLVFYNFYANDRLGDI